MLFLQRFKLGAMLILNGTELITVLGLQFGELFSAHYLHTVELFAVLFIAGPLLVVPLGKILLVLPLEVLSRALVLGIHSAQIFAVKIVAGLQLAVLSLHVFSVLGSHVLHELLVLVDHALRGLHVVRVAFLLLLHLDGQLGNVLLLFGLALSVQLGELLGMGLLEGVHEASVLLKLSSHRLRLKVHLAEVGLLNFRGLLLHSIDLLLKIRDLLGQSIRVHLVLFGIFLDLVGNFVDSGLQILAGSFALAEHVFVLLEVALEVDVYGQFLVEADKQVLEVLLFGAAALEVHVEVHVLPLLHHVGRETVHLHLAGHGGAARAAAGFTSVSC